MRYLFWAFLALASYTAVPPLMKAAMRDIPADVAVFVSNGILVLFAFALALRTGALDAVIGHPDAKYLYAGGAFLTVGILAFYRALNAGPVSRVVPIFGLFIATSSVVGMLAFEEPRTLRKGVGILFALVAVVLTSVE